MSLVLKKLTLRNFLSFGNETSEIDLSFKGTVHIIGENLDTSGANGVGKTTLLNAILYALYGKPISNISKDRLINKTNSSKNTQMEVKLIFEKGNDEYTITRTRGETYSIKLLKNDKDITPDSVSNVDKKIVDIIGISYDLFSKIVVFAGSARPFLDMSVSEQRSHIEELFKITSLSEKAVMLKDKIKTTEKDIEIQQVLIKTQEEANKLQQKHIEEAQVRVLKWEDEKDKNSSYFKEKIESLKDFDFDKENELHNEMSRVDSDIKKLNSQLVILETNKNSELKRIDKIDSEIDHLNEKTCPYCLQKYENTSDKVKELSEEKLKKTEFLSNIESSITLHKNDINALKNTQEQIKSNLKFETLKDAILHKGKLDSWKKDLAIYESGINPHLEAYESLLSEKVKEINYEKIDELKSELEHQQFLLKLLTDKNSFIRRKIISKTIPFLNKRLSHYTTELGLPHIIKFNPDMTCDVSEHGRELDFGNLSAGEQRRVNLSLSLSFRDVLHHLHLPINILLVDEIDAGSIDSTGMDQIIRILKQKSRDEKIGTWIISHRQEMNGRFDCELLIQKENGFSRFIKMEET